jgi:hypothetical protein
MYDSVDPFAIPAEAAMVAGYVDGTYRWPQSGWDRFPHAVKVRIAVHASTNDGLVLDREPGDATAAEAVDWVLMRRRAGVDPWVYCSLSDWPACRNAFAARNVAEPHWWVAAYPGPTDSHGTPVIPAGAVAHQYTDATRPDGTHHWDESIVADYVPGIDPAPNPVHTEDDMFKFIADLSTPIGPGQAGYTRVALLRDNGTITGVSWAEAASKDKGYQGDGTGSILGLQKSEFDNFEADSDAIKAANKALAKLVVGGAAVVPVTYEIVGTATPKEA